MNGPIPAVGHIPFPGHRTLKEVRQQREASGRELRAMEFGFNPESLEPPADALMEALK